MNATSAAKTGGAENDAARILTYLRVRPILSLLENDDDALASGLMKPNDSPAPSIDVVTSDGRSRRCVVRFGFDKVFGHGADQKTIFDCVAKKLVLTALEGYNATLFAYGQTGSGKTFTITGGTKHYSLRGIIPRALELIFHETSRRTELDWRVQVSYMEIYNEIAYDLLDPNHEADSMEELPRVNLRMNESGEVQFMNLNKHPVETHEQALNLLFLGDTNRTIAETPMNPVSSRSHCIFTVYIESKAEGTNTTRRSKLHLVDLAGSERVTRTGSSGQRFREAIYINKALHFLEQVITSLWKKDKHIPYRNSKITQVLRDSLGGNCCTAMIATLSPTCSSLAESISTCQFAQRVACVHNHAVVNQHVDPQIEIERLRHQLELLKAQMQPSSASDGDEGGAEVNIAECRELVTNYLEDPSPNSVLVLRNPRLSVECCRLLKEQVLEWKARAESMSITNDNVRAANKLQAKLMEREKEVAMLVSLMRNRTHTEEENTPEPAPPVTGKAVADLNDPPQNRHPEHYQFRQTQLPSQNDLHGSSALQNGNSPSIMMPQQRPYGKNAHQDTLHLLPTCPNPSFEDFRRQHPDNLAVVENTTLLQSMYKQAKSVAAQMEATRQHINSLKMAIEQHRLKRAMFLLEQGQESSGAEAVQQQVPRTIEEEQLCRQIEQERQSYKNQMAKLQALKSTTQTLEIMLRRLHSKIQSDFQLLGKIISEQCSDEITSDPPPTTGAFKQPVSVLEPQCFNTTRNTTEPPTHQGTREGTRPRHHTVTMPEDRRTLLENSGPAATLTGVAEADEEIRAFYRARDELTAHKANPQPPHRNKT